MENDKRVIALGFFDGVHLGHKALFDKTVQRAKELNITPAIISFDMHPDRLVKGENVPLLNSPFDRADLVSRLFGITDMLFLHFDKEMMMLDWEAFAEWLVDDFHAAHLVAGYDFTFGYKGLGTSEKLMQKCKVLGIGCDIIPKVTLKGTTVSSSYIRQLLLDGKVMKANRFLGHPHTLTDIVRHGYRFGRTLGVPTINMRFEEGVLVPVYGVYAAKAFLEDGQEHMAVTNIGVRPTVGGQDAVSVESHILDYSGNLYGKKVRIEFYKFLRGEVKFVNTDELKAQIAADILETREFFEEKEKTNGKHNL